MAKGKVTLEFQTGTTRVKGDAMTVAARVTKGLNRAGSDNLGVWAPHLEGVGFSWKETDRVPEILPSAVV